VHEFAKRPPRNQTIAFDDLWQNKFVWKEIVLQRDINICIYILQNKNKDLLTTILTTMRGIGAPLAQLGSSR